jgi:exodeoxyribonuclease VII large subunit
MNKELPFPALPQRIAIITSPTAAGYGDFLSQLSNNRQGYAFYTKLFPAIMQGDKAESSVLAAIDSIFSCANIFDVIVIIRGGGASSELNCFDSYPLAAACAQSLLPVMTGIGHERDDTILDMVANRRLKTPTAVAEYLISCMDAAASETDDFLQGIVSMTANLLQKEKNLLQTLGMRLPASINNHMERNRSVLISLGNRLPVSASKLIEKHRALTERSMSALRQTTLKQLDAKGHFLKLTEQFIQMASPDYILKRGYSITLKDGKILKKAADFNVGDVISTRFDDGIIVSRVSEKKDNN